MQQLFFMQLSPALFSLFIECLSNLAVIPFLYDHARTNRDYNLDTASGRILSQMWCFEQTTIISPSC
jgi:hypothetical protein